MSAGRLQSRAVWIVCLTCIIALGILSRVVHTGFVLVDKYLGDALYAAMVYTIARWWLRPGKAAAWAMIIMTILEVFQLTMIPAHMLRNGHLMVRIIARLMGTEFSFLDLAAYAAGIGCISLIDSAFGNNSAFRNND